MLYCGFGGWTIARDGHQVYPALTKRGDVRRHRDRTIAVGDKRLAKIERVAQREPGDWRARFDSPLRDAEYQRQGKGRWVLIASGPGFA